MSSQEQIFNAAIVVAKRSGYRNITRAALAEQLGKSVPWVQLHVDIAELSQRLARQAVELDLPAGEFNAGPGRGGNTAWVEERKAAILAGALKVAARDGLLKTTRKAVASAAGCSTGLVSKRFGSMAALYGEVVKEAVRLGVLPVIRDGLVLRMPEATSAPDDLKRKAVAAA